MVDSFSRLWYYRTDIVRIVAEREGTIEWHTGKHFEGFRLLPGDIDADFLHHLYGAGTDSGLSYPRGKNLVPATVPRPEVTLCHLGSCGVGRAYEQDSGFCRVRRYTCLLFQFGIFRCFSIRFFITIASHSVTTAFVYAPDRASKMLASPMISLYGSSAADSIKNKS
jgi:hypothetical protein